MDFKISRSNKQCSVCSRKFKNGEKYYAGLVSRPKEEGVFDRADVCAECWGRQGAGSFSAYWLSEFSTDKKPLLFDPDSLWQVLNRALSTEEAGKRDAAELKRFAYVAALGLVRLKQLKLKDTKRTKSGDIMVLETPARVKERRVFQVPDLGLDEKGIEAIQDRLAELA